MAKNTRKQTGVKPREWSWKEHRLWCERLWEEGPEKARLREVARKIREVQEQFRKEGTPQRVPNLQEGRDPGVVSEIYYMHHLPSGKGYVGLAYHGAHEKMNTHWSGRNTEKHPSSTLMPI